MTTSFRQQLSEQFEAIVGWLTSPPEYKSITPWRPWPAKGALAVLHLVMVLIIFIFYKNSFSFFDNTELVREEKLQLTTDKAAGAIRHEYAFFVGSFFHLASSCSPQVGKMEQPAAFCMRGALPWV